MTKVYIINSNRQYDTMFTNRGFELVGSVKEADLVQFTGGEDVTPHLYGQSKHPRTFCNPERDVYEMGLYHQALSLGKRMAGICRGGQFLHIMTGGSMYQHIEGHTRDHDIFVDGESYRVTSTHHQGMVPNHNTVVVADATINGITKEIQEIGIASILDTTFGNYDYNVLMYQPHPEFDEGECQDLYFDLLEAELGIVA